MAVTDREKRCLLFFELDKKVNDTLKFSGVDEQEVNGGRKSGSRTLATRHR